MVITVDSQLEGPQFESYGNLIFDSCFMKSALRINRDIKFEILVEDSDIGGPNSITVRIECLFVCQF